MGWAGLNMTDRHMCNLKLGTALSALHMGSIQYKRGDTSSMQNNIEIFREVINVLGLEVILRFVEEGILIYVRELIFLFVE